jgi:hypothetical protein
MILMSRSDVERTDNVALEGPGDVEYPDVLNRCRKDGQCRLSKDPATLYILLGAISLMLFTFGKELLDSRWDSREETIWQTTRYRQNVDEEKGIQFGLMLLILLTRLEQSLR